MCWYLVISIEDDPLVVEFVVVVEVPADVSVKADVKSAVLVAGSVVLSEIVEEKVSGRGVSVSSTVRIGLGLVMLKQESEN